MAQILTDRAVIALCGPEARSYLQALVTNSVPHGRGSAYAALLTPQGKILFDFLIHGDGDDLFLDCHHSAAEGLIKRLSLYKLRANVTITRRDDLAVVLDGPEDPRLAALGGRGIGRADGAPADANYLTRRLDLGVPEGPDFGSGAIFAMDAGLDELHAIDFKKGCYIGQELTARMKHRGTDRKRLITIVTTDGSPLPAKDSAISAGAIELGSITATYGARGFALIRLDRLAEAKDPVTVDGISVELIRQSWLFT